MSTKLTMSFDDGGDGRKKLNRLNTSRLQSMYRRLGGDPTGMSREELKEAIAERKAEREAIQGEEEEGGDGCRGWRRWSW